MNYEHADDHHGQLGHIVPFSVYRNVLIMLLALTAITIWVAKDPNMDFGYLNIVIAMVIASMKASLVALFFMHLKFEDKITWLYATIPLFLLVLMMGGIFIDNPLRAPEMPVQVVDPLAAQFEAAEAE